MQLSGDAFHNNLKKSPKTQDSMKTRNSRILITAASALLLVQTVFAQDQNGTWTNTLGGTLSWTASGNWADNAIANGSGFTSNFVPPTDIAADTTVTLDGVRTIGNLVFGDADTNTVAGWTLTNGTSGPLTLAGTSPTLTVNALGTGKSATITATLEGTSGFTKTGAGTLILNNNTNTITGPVVISQGNLNLQSKPLTGASSVAIDGGVLILATATGNALGANNDAKISFNGGTLQFNVDNMATDYSARFSTDPGQKYKIFVITAGTPAVPRIAIFGADLASEGGTLEKSGAGTLVLNAPNTFTGATTRFNGTLQLNDPLALQNSPINTTDSLVGTATSGILLNAVTSPTFGGLTGNKALASLFDTDPGNYDLVTNITLKPVTGADYTYTGMIADGRPALDGGMTLTKSGPGRQVLNALNTYTGGTIMTAGTLNYSNASALSTGSITFTGGSILQAGVATTLPNPINVTGIITGTLGTNGFATTLSGAITGTGTLAKGGAGVLTLTGGLANTIAGGFRVASGRLVVTDGLSLTNAGPVTVLSGGSLNYSKNFGSGNNLTNNLTLSGPGDGTFGALNIWANATATGTITLDANATISHDFNNATISGAISGTDRNLTLTTLTAGQPGMLVSGPITLGTGGITVQGVANSGDFSIHLTGANSYTGETRVVSGTLKLSGSARIDDTAALRVESGAVVNLAFSGNDEVAALYLGSDPNPQPAGTYGSTTSTATNKSAFFVGDGIIEVAPATNNYNSWATTNGIPGEPFDEDFNEDGISNGVAYALGLSPTEYEGPAGVLSGDTITFTKGTDAIANADVSWIIQVSETLEANSWTDEVTQAPGNTDATISLDLDPQPGTPSKFARLKAVKTP
jgi:autotransporter-associated beta strand protein